MTAMKTMASNAANNASEIQRIIAAADAANSAKQCRTDDTLSAAENELRSVIQEANDRGISWQSIGDALGLRRGAAYQRFRRHPIPGCRAVPPRASGPAHDTTTEYPSAAATAPHHPREAPRAALEDGAQHRPALGVGVTLTPSVPATIQ